MSHPLQSTFGPYDILRMPPRASTNTPPLYVVRRPDGSVCCEGVTWPEVEQAIERDETARGQGQAGNA